MSSQELLKGVADQKQALDTQTAIIDAYDVRCPDLSLPDRRLDARFLFQAQLAHKDNQHAEKMDSLNAEAAEKRAQKVQTVNTPFPDREHDDVASADIVLIYRYIYVGGRTYV